MLQAHNLRVTEGKRVLFSGAGFCGIGCINGNGKKLVKTNKKEWLFCIIMPVAKKEGFHYNVRYTKTCVCVKWMLF